MTVGLGIGAKFIQVFRLSALGVVKRWMPLSDL